MSDSKPLSDDFDFPELDMEFDFDIGDFASMEIDLQLEFDSRYIKPPRSKQNEDTHCRYDNALKLAHEIEITKDSRHYLEVNGTFIFGDFIEALFHKKGWEAHRVIISTLSMSMNNVDSLSNMIKWGWVDKLDLIVSDYFYSHERQMLVEYLYEKCDIDNRFQLAAARTHEKTCLIQTKCGLFIVIDGSINLRSSGNLEQFRIEENEILFNFILESQDRILNKFFTIDKSLNRKETWQAVVQEVRAEPKKTGLQRFNRPKDKALQRDKDQTHAAK